MTAERKRPDPYHENGKPIDNGQPSPFPLTDLLALKKEPLLAPAEILIPSEVHTGVLGLLALSESERREYTAAYRHRRESWAQGQVEIGPEYTTDEDTLYATTDNKAAQRIVGRFRHPHLIAHTHPQIPEEIVRKQYADLSTALRENTQGTVEQVPTFERFATALSLRTSVPSGGDIHVFMRLKTKVPLHVIYSATGITLFAAINAFDHERDSLRDGWRDYLTVGYYRQHLFADVHAPDSTAHRTDALEKAADIIATRGVLYFTPTPQNPVLSRVDGAGNYDY